MTYRRRHVSCLCVCVGKGATVSVVSAITTGLYKAISCDFNEYNTYMCACKDTILTTSSRLNYIYISFPLVSPRFRSFRSCLLRDDRFGDTVRFIPQPEIRPNIYIYIYISSCFYDDGFWRPFKRRQRNTYIVYVFWFKSDRLTRTVYVYNL